MKQFLLTIACLSTIMAYGASYVPNGSFEEWIFKTCEYPTFYPFNSNVELFFSEDTSSNVTKTTDAQHGMYAIKLVTQVSGEDVNFGYFVNSNPDNGNPSTWTGGTPISEKPTGITGHYKYLTSPGDTAMLIMAFSKAGVNIGSYFYYLNPTGNSYTQFQFNFSPALTETPDSVSIGFVSSNPMTEKGLQGSTLYIDNISLEGVISQPPMLNGDFEDWVSHTLEKPLYWGIDGKPQETVSKTTQARDGQYALQLKTYKEYNNDGESVRSTPCRASLGDWNEQTMQWEGCIFLSGTEDRLAFYYKYMPARPSDSASVQLKFVDKGGMMNFREVYLKASPSYQLVEIPFEMDFNMIKPDRLIIEAFSTLWYNRDPAAIGSTLILDNFYLIDAENNPKPPPGDTAITLKSFFPNGDFELWDSVSYEYPEHFEFTSNMMKIGYDDPVFNAVKTTDAQNGMYALKLVTDNTTDNVNFGFIVNTNAGEGDPTQWHGGIPIFEKPSGIVGYYKYNEAVGDSGMMIVSFSKQGTQLQNYYFPLKGAQTTYTQFDFTFDPELQEVPDSMILGFISSYSMDTLGLPGCELYIDNIALKGVTSQPPALNGDFESWLSVTTYSPQSWYVDGWESDRFSRTSDAAQGQYAIELRTILGSDGEHTRARQGSISNGYWMEECSCELGGIPYQNTKDTLAFQYKYLPANEMDRARIQLNFIRDGNSIWYENVELTASADYRHKRIPIDLFKHQTPAPDTVIVSIISSDWDNDDVSFAGAVLRLDNLHFTSEFYIPPVIDPNAPNGLIPNGGFEKWDTKTYVYPDNYLYNTNLMIAEMTTDFDPCITRTEDAQHGSAAVRIFSSGQFGNEPIPGFILLSEPSTNGSPENWHGGLPINEAPSGIRGYFKYNQATADTALVIVTFSKGGTNIGAYVYPLTGVQTTYTLFDSLFNPPLTQTPDSFLLGFTSGNVMSESYIAGSELYIDNVSFTGISTQPAGMNGDFEDWEEVVTEFPASWYTQRGGDKFLTKTTNAAVGSYAVELHSMLIEGNSENTVYPGYLASAILDDNDEEFDGGIPIGNLSDTLAFYYKYVPGNISDTATVFMVFRSGYEFVWYREQKLSASAEYQFVTIPFEASYIYTKPDNVSIFAMSSLESSNDLSFAGSVLTLDEFYFKSSRWPVSLPEIRQTEHLSLYPNPSSGRVMISDPTGTYEKVSIYNLTGQLVMTFNKKPGTTLSEIDLTGRPAGMYLVRLDNNQQKEVMKLILK